MTNDMLSNLQSLQAAAPGPVSRRTLVGLAVAGWAATGALLAMLVIVIFGGGSFMTVLTTIFAGLMCLWLLVALVVLGGGRS